MKPHGLRLERATYPHMVEIQGRFADVDPLWHFNNVRILELYQEARVSFNLAVWELSSLDARSQRLMIARQSVDYLGEVWWPGSVTIGVGVAHIGTTSYSIGLAMFQNDKCMGISDAVLVHAGQAGSAPIPARVRDVLATKRLAV